MFCPKCGNKCGNQDSFCNQCGYNFKEYVSGNAPISNQVSNSHADNVNKNAAQVQPKQPANPVSGTDISSKYAESYFDGTGFQLLGWNLLCGLLSVVTLGFGIPFACCLKIRWETKHTVLNGKRLYFSGTALQLFGRMILWGLILAGIIIAPIIMAVCVSYISGSGHFRLFTFYSFFPFVLLFDILVSLFGGAFYSVYIKKWIIKHTTFIGDKSKINKNINNMSVNAAAAASGSSAPDNKINSGESETKRNIQSDTYNSYEENLSQMNSPLEVKTENTSAKNSDALKNDGNSATENEEYYNNYIQSTDYQNYSNNNINSCNYNNVTEYDTEKIYCPVCSSEIEYGIDSCPYCGSVFRWD